MSIGASARHFADIFVLGKQGLDANKVLFINFRANKSKINRIHDGVETETRKFLARFKIF